MIICPKPYTTCYCSFIDNPKYCYYWCKYGKDYQCKLSYDKLYIYFHK